MNIILNFDPSVANAPPGFMFAIYQAAAIYDALFTTSLTVTIDVGYGEIDGENLPAGDASSSLTDYNTVSYAALAAALPAADALPASDPTNGTGTYEIAAPLQAMLGLGGGNPVEYIGVAAVPLDVTPGTAPAAGQYDLTGLALHEISEVLGRYALGGLGGNYAALDLLRYVAPGTLALASPAASALSVDGGAALSGDFNNAGSGIDLGDWAGYSGDAYGAAWPGGTMRLSQIDLAEMAALGYAETRDTIGTGQSLLGQGGADTFYLGSDGTILVEENAMNGLLGMATLQIDNTAQQVAPGTSVLGTASNFLGAAGNDVVFRNAAGYLYVLEYNVSCQMIGGDWLTNPDGGIDATAPGTTMIGMGAGLLATGGNDMVFSTASGGLYVYEYNIDGTLTGGAWLTNPDGAISNAAPGTTVLGSDTNLLGAGGNDLIFRVASGALYVFEYNASGALTGATWLRNPDGGIDVAAADTTVIGSAIGLFVAGGNDVFFRTGGALYAFEYNTAGILTGANWLTNPGGGTETVAAGTTIIGSGSDLLGAGGTDVFFRGAAGNLGVVEYNTAAVAISTATLADPTTGAITAAPGTTVIGTATDFLGQGGEDVFFRTALGTVYAFEFNPQAELIGATWITNATTGQDVMLGAGLHIIGGGGNAFGLGGPDLYLQQPGTGIFVMEGNGGGAILAARWQ